MGDGGEQDEEGAIICEIKCSLVEKVGKRK